MTFDEYKENVRRCVYSCSQASQAGRCLYPESERCSILMFLRAKTGWSPKKPKDYVEYDGTFELVERRK